MSRERKQSDSPSGYCREVYKVRRDVLEVIETQEQAVRRLTNERWQRRVQALLPVVNPGPCDFDGCVE